MLINTPAALESFLETRGYAPQVTGNSVCLALGTGTASQTAAFTFGAEQLRITCQVAVLGDFAENQLAHFSLAALDANMQISPYAFAVIGASHGEVEIERCPLVVTDTLLISDLHEEEVAFALDKLLEALAFSREFLSHNLTH